MKIDLHCHTTASDGIYTPQELIEFAIKNEVSTIAITDHDTINGIEEGLTYSKDKNIKVIPGIEFSVEHESGAFHLLGFYIDYKNKELCEKLEKLQKYRDERIVYMLDSLKKASVEIPLDEVIKEACGGAIGKPHVARVMVRHGFGKSVDEIFQKYLADGKPGDVPKERISPENAIELILKSGGLPVIAHPASLEYKDIEKFEEFIKPLIELGIVGIEAYSTMHNKESVSNYIEIANKYNLIITGGSDFHGDKGEKIGYYSKENLIPVELLKKLKK